MAGLLGAGMPNAGLLSPATVNPLMARKAAAQRGLLTQPTSVMDPRYAAWKQSQDQADTFLMGADLLGAAVPFAGPAAKLGLAGAKSLAPQAANMAEGYMARTGLLKNMLPESNIPPMELWHGSPEQIPKITDSGIFGGVFASQNKNSALSHGENLHRFEIPESKILKQNELQNIDNSEFKKLLSIKDDGAIERMRQLVIDGDFPIESDLRLLRSSDPGEASWEAQRLRGVIANKKGFHAIEMPDEHGTSYLVLPHAKILDRK